MSGQTQSLVSFEVAHEQRHKWTTHYLCVCMCVCVSFWGPQYPHSGTGNTLQEGLVWQSSAWRLSWGEALQQPGWDKAAYPQGHGSVMVCAANLPLAIHWVWISSMGENHFDIRSLANWLLLCLWTLNSVSSLVQLRDALSKGGLCQYN